METLMKLRVVILTGLFVLLAVPAFAIDLHSARHAGVLGEKTDGYVAVLKSSPDAIALATQVNDKRRHEYARISAQNSQPVDVVAKLAAVQIINGLQTGDSYQAADGSWKTR